MGRILWVLLVIKLGIVAWNSTIFDGLTYDEKELQGPRSRSAGLSLSGRSYNPPLYYVPAAPLVFATGLSDLMGEGVDERDLKAFRRHRRRKDRGILAGLRWTNLGHVAVFYLAWIGVIFPRVLGDRRRATLASLLLLVLPGYQKMAAMAHPDNALTSLTGLGIACWLVMRERVGGVGRRVYWLAVIAGLVALTRPFGILPAAALTVACICVVGGETRWRGRVFIRRSLVSVALAVAIAGSWTGYQLVGLGQLSPVYNDRHLLPYVYHRRHFDRVEYFSSFYVPELLKVPNRKMNVLDTQSGRFNNRYGNSFWTLAYSELWGDHWLYFSGRYRSDTKAWVKRVLLFCALPTIPLGFFGFVRGVFDKLRALVSGSRMRQIEWPLFVLGMMLLGTGMYLYWHLSSGLTPGKNSSVKFIYSAYLVPLFIVTMFSRPLRAFWSNWLRRYLLGLFIISVPFVVYIPQWLNFSGGKLDDEMESEETGEEAPAGSEGGDLVVPPMAAPVPGAGQPAGMPVAPTVSPGTKSGTKAPAQSAKSAKPKKAGMLKPSKARKSRAKRRRRAPSRTKRPGQRVPKKP